MGPATPRLGSGAVPLHSLRGRGGCEGTAVLHREGIPRTDLPQDQVWVKIRGACGMVGGWGSASATRLATSVCQASHIQASLGPTEPCTGCSRFLLSSGYEWGEYYRVAHSTGLIPNENQISCRTLVACLSATRMEGESLPWWNHAGEHRHADVAAPSSCRETINCCRCPRNVPFGAAQRHRLTLDRRPLVWCCESHSHAVGAEYDSSEVRGQFSGSLGKRPSEKRFSKAFRRHPT